MYPIKRRRFLLIAAGTAASVGAARWSRRSGGLFEGDTRCPVATRKTFALGTEVSITVRHSSVEVAEQAIEAAFGELALVERLMSIYRPDSQISVLNRTGWLANPHPYVREVLRHATFVSRRSRGAFDVTVQPLWVVFAAAAKENRLPEPAEIAAARQKVDWTKLDVSRSDCVRLWPPGMAITLNGIAQGYATDRVLATLRSAGVEHALIHAGEHASLGHSARGNAWTIGIQHPRHADAFIALADLDGRCLATSGDYASAFSADLQFNHIFDPRTGYSPTELASVSVLARTAMQADALSTALFVLGPDQGLELVHGTPQCDAFFVMKSGETIATSGFPVSREGRSA